MCNEKSPDFIEPDSFTKDRLDLLISYLGSCEQKHKKLLNFAYQKDSTFINAISYYSGEMSRLQILIASLLLDENLTNHDGTHDLLNYFNKNGKNYTQDEKIILEAGLSLTEEYLANKRKHYINYLVNNYVVHFYSNFEEFMAKLYDCLNEEDKRNQVDQKNEELLQLIQKYCKENITQLHTEICKSRPIYLFGRAKIEKIVSVVRKILETQEKISKNAIKKEFSRFYNALNCINKIRNTVHTGFVYYGEKTYTFNSFLSTNNKDIIKIEKNKGIFYGDYREAFGLIQLLLQMYTTCLTYILTIKFHELRMEITSDGLGVDIVCHELKLEENCDKFKDFFNNIIRK